MFARRLHLHIMGTDGCVYQQHSSERLPTSKSKQTLTLPVEFMTVSSLFFEDGTDQSWIGEWSWGGYPDLILYRLFCSQWVIKLQNEHPSVWKIT